MLNTLIVILVLLFFLGYIKIPAIQFKDIAILNFGKIHITLWDILIFLAIIWVIEILPKPLRQIALVLFALWILSTLGVLSTAGLSQLLFVAIIIGVILAAAKK